MGMQLQVFWQKTLKQALSPQSSPRSANSPSTTPNDAPSQETFLPVFSNQASDSNEIVLEGGVDLPQGSNITQTAPAADPSLYSLAALDATPAGPGNKETQSGSLEDSSMHGLAFTNHTFTLYANASTQTEPSMEQSMFAANSESDQEEDTTLYEGGRQSLEEVGPLATPETEVSDEPQRPEIYDGGSQVIVTDFNGKKHLAILVTQGMVDSLNVVGEYSAKLQRVAGKLEAAKDKVDLTNIDVRYIEGCIEEAKSREEVEELHEELAERKSTLPADTRRRDDLQEFADVYDIHVKCDREACLDTLRAALTDAGLLRTHFERDQWEPVDGDGDKEEDGADQPKAFQSSESELEMLPFDGNSQCTDYSRVSVEELFRRAVHEEVRQRYREYYEAENEFDARHLQYAHTKERWRQLVRDGECSMTQTAFDHCDFEATRELGNEMFAAEEAYEEALARRNRLGLGGSDQESGFFMDMGDGYPLSWEGEGIASAPRPFIEDWLKDIPEVEYISDIADLSKAGGHEFEREEPEGINEWDARSAQMSDTWSCRDLTRNKKRIHRWRELCGRDR